MRLFLIYMLFVVTEYILRTIVDVNSFYQLKLPAEFLPLIILAPIAMILYKQVIVTQRKLWTYLKLSAVSIAGYFTAIVITFFQWYWLLHPEYQNVYGDINEGLALCSCFSLSDHVSSCSLI